MKDESGLAAPNFAQRVYALVQTIPRGQVATYGQVALHLGAPRAARAVGNALKRLPAHFKNVPWHRVVCANGTVAQKSYPGRPSPQIKKLRAEGVPMDKNGRIALPAVQWRGPPEQGQAFPPASCA